VIRVGLALAAILLLAGCGADNGGAPGDSNVKASDAELLTLRLSDLPPGFVLGDDRGCGGLGVEGASDRLAAFVVDVRPTSCLSQFEYVGDARADVPAVVESSAIVLADSDEARRAFDLWRDLVAFSLGFDRVEEEGEAVGLGDVSVVFSTRDPLVQEHMGRTGYGVVWRSGNVVDFVFQGGLGGENGHGLALDLAKTQQERSEKHAPIAQTETDDREVELDTSTVGVPVYWLGTQFDPAGKLPPLELVEAITLEPGGGPGSQVKIGYGANGRITGVTLDLWTPVSYKRFKGTRLGLMVWSWPCTEAKEIRLPGGRAVIYAGYSEPAREPCAKRPFDRYLAYAYFDGVVVAVNMVYCYMCAARGRPETDPYNSFAGMEAVVTGLRQR